MYCGNCGKEVVESQQFCANCGTPVNQENGEIHDSSNSLAGERKKISCPECGHHVAKAATVCPECGNKLKMSGVPTYIMCGFLMFIAAIFMYIGETTGDTSAAIPAFIFIGLFFALIIRLGKKRYDRKLSIL